MIVSMLSASSPALPVWVRASGDYSREQPPRLAEAQVPLEPVQRKRMKDLQYDRMGDYEGVPLEQILRSYEAPKEVDTALLHFSNEMLVPVPLRELEKLGVFVAVRTCSAEACTAEFAPVAKKDQPWADRRPIRFTSNKVVVVAAADKRFSPFRHTSTLTGIELVNGRAYDRQFEVSEAPNVRAGLATFRERCQFCHGARGVGANFGWDYVKPIALYTYRSPKSLAMHVRHRESDAHDKGLMMPAIADVDDAAAGALWELLEAFAKNPLKPYTVP
ncbi:MAG: cytochrome c [Deltaproteobacteria bacterium]|nr:cytochrome c [Deltaproteobacteria bacterium]